MVRRGSTCPPHRWPAGPGWPRPRPASPCSSRSPSGTSPRRSAPPERAAHTHASHRWTRTAPATSVCAIGAAGHGQRGPVRRSRRAGHAGPAAVLATRRVVPALDRCYAQAAGTSLSQDGTAGSDWYSWRARCATTLCSSRVKRSEAAVGSNVFPTSRAGGRCAFRTATRIR